MYPPAPSFPHHGLILGSLQVLCQLLQLIDSSLDLLHVARHLTLTESVYLSLVLFQQSFKLCLPALDRSNVTMLSLFSCPLPRCDMPLFDHVLSLLPPRGQALLAHLKDGVHSPWPVECLVVQLNVFLCKETGHNNELLTHKTLPEHKR